MSRHDDRVSLRHMLEYAQTARRLVAGRKRPDLDSDEMLRLALTRAVEVMGEAAKRVAPERQARWPGFPGSKSWPPVIV